MHKYHACTPACAVLARHTSAYVLRHYACMGMACDSLCAEVQRELASRSPDEPHRPCKRCRTGVGPTVDFCLSCSEKQR
jgi:hypothetical protein